MVVRESALVVDDISSSMFNEEGETTTWSQGIISLKEYAGEVWADSNFYISSPYFHEHDGYPIDEEHFIEWDCIRSTNPDSLKALPNCSCGR